MGFNSAFKGLRYTFFGLLRILVRISWRFDGSWCLDLYDSVVTLLEVLDPEVEGITIFRNVRKFLPKGTEYLQLYIYIYIYIYISVTKRFSTLSDTQTPLLPIFPLTFIQVSFVHGLPYTFHPVFLWSSSALDIYVP